MEPEVGFVLGIFVVATGQSRIQRKRKEKKKKKVEPEVGIELGIAVVSDVLITTKLIVVRYVSTFEFIYIQQILLLNYLLGICDLNSNSKI